MKIKSLGLFVGGVVVGALSGAAVTYHYLAVKFRDEEDEEIAKAKARYDKQLEEAKRSRQNFVRKSQRRTLRSRR